MCVRCLLDLLVNRVHHPHHLAALHRRSILKCSQKHTHEHEMAHLVALDVWQVLTHQLLNAMHLPAPELITTTATKPCCPPGGSTIYTHPVGAPDDPRGCGEGGRRWGSRSLPGSRRSSGRQCMPLRERERARSQSVSHEREQGHSQRAGSFWRDHSTNGRRNR